VKLKKQINKEILKILKDKETPQDVVQKVLCKLTNYTHEKIKSQQIKKSLDEIGISR